MKWFTVSGEMKFSRSLMNGRIKWADSDNGSTVALQASGRGSIPRRSTNNWKLGRAVDCNGLENRRTLKCSESSNLSVSANIVSCLRGLRAHPGKMMVVLHGTRVRISHSLPMFMPANSKNPY